MTPVLHGPGDPLGVLASKSIVPTGGVPTTRHELTAEVAADGYLVEQA